MTTNIIMQAQKELADAGYDPGPADGLMSERTSSELKMYKQELDKKKSNPSLFLKAIIDSGEATKSSMQAFKTTSLGSSYEEVLKSVNAMKEKYENNNYVRLSGFDLVIGIPPGVSLSFEFK